MELPKQARVIAGRYRLESLIGEGGMASVWRARDLTLEREVAVKLLFARDERDKDRLVQQFVREARIAASVQHRNVIQIVDFGTIEGQQPFMVMELLEGETLGQRFHREPKVSVPDLIRLASLTLRGLAAVHDAGIIHRDLKPENIYLAREGTGEVFPKILDFGISRSVEPRSGRRSALTTREGMIVGTPEYMSPEQARGVRSIDKRTDIYSMGAILYEGLTGHLPFSSENVGDLIIQIVTGAFTKPHEIDPNVPHGLSEVVAKAMSRLPDDRYSDAFSMQQALLAAAEEALEHKAWKSLSDIPPPPSAHSGSVPRASADRLRTLEFALESAAHAEADDEVDTKIPPPPNVPQVELPANLRGSTTGRRVLVAAVAVAGMIAGGIWLSQRGSGAAASEPAARAAANLTEAAKPEAASAPQPAPQLGVGTITVSLHGLPPHAAVSVDGQPGAGDVIELPRDGRDRVIRVTAPGVVPWQVVHHASADASFDVTSVKDDEALRAQARKRQASGAPRSDALATPAARKKPPSALRKLDF